MSIFTLIRTDCLKILKYRGREYEKVITIEYLQKIQESYFSFFRQNPENKYLVIDINEIDFVTNEDHYSKIRDAILSNDYPVGLNKVIL